MCQGVVDLSACGPRPEASLGGAVRVNMEQVFHIATIAIVTTLKSNLVGQSFEFRMEFVV